MQQYPTEKYSEPEKVFSSIDSLIVSYQPQLPVEQLVLAINNLFHRFDAQIYDFTHPEIYERLPEIWRDMCMVAKDLLGPQPVRILDYGCGTGFASEQALRYFPSVAALTCYDPSPEMIAKCRKRIAPQYPTAVFCSSLDEVSGFSPYSLLLTNSVLHHLPNIEVVTKEMLSILESNALWLAGHEPSCRFFKNVECVAHLEAYQRKVLLPGGSFSAFLSLLRHKKDDPYRKTANASVKEGLFKRRPSAQVIDRLVDFHVAHSTEETNAGRGFDFEIMQEEMQETWALAWLKIYGYLGGFYDGNLKGKWAKSGQELARRYPKDGTNFCALWQRIGI